ncbi:MULTISPECIES: hypothetical protein [Nostocaceae]|nr:MULTISPECIES: hypothetical protein [Nostocaceae]
MRKIPVIYAGDISESAKHRLLQVGIAAQRTGSFMISNVSITPA